MFAFFLLPRELCGQDLTVSLSATDTPLREIMDDIERQTGLSFAYNSRLLDDRQPVSVTLNRTPLEVAVQEVFSGKKIRIIQLEKQIVLRRSREELPPPDASPASDDLPVAYRYSVSGYARDVATGEVLIGATVSVPGGGTGTITNPYGFYSLTLDGTADSLTCSYVGYGEVSLPVGPGSARVDFKLKERFETIGEVVVYSDENDNSLKTARSSDQRIRTESVRKMPALFGEKDVIKSLASIPGVKFFGDGSTIFYVRGGSRDQNMITLDEAPLYNPTHLLGLFSTIVPDAIKDIRVYKGDFPANYGGRLSSHIDIRTKDGNMNRFGMDGSLGLLSTRLSLEGPIWQDRISYFISGRRSYFAWLLKGQQPNINDLHFADLHLKLNYRINDRNRIFIATYTSEDNFETRGGLGDVSGINWQNATFTTRWNHVFSDRMFSNTTLHASRYDYFLNTDLTRGNYWNSHINNVSLKTDFTWYVHPRNTLRFGARIAQHFMNPGNFYQAHEVLPLPYEISTRSANESNIYISDQWLIGDRWSLRMGLRVTGWNNIGRGVEYAVEDNTLQVNEYAPGEVYHTYVTGDPRIGLVYRPGSNGLWTFSFTRTSQFEHLITNSISPFTTLEVWLPSGPNIRPQRANQLTGGYTHQFRKAGLEAGMEVYIKQMSDQIDYRDHANMLMNPFIDFELRFGEGRAYGLETMLSKKEGRLTGWISYTLSRSEMQIDGINRGQPYPAYGDRPHDLSLYISYRLSQRLLATANFIYMTGAPITTPTAFYYYENYQVPVYFKRNNDRLPDYHRLDLSLNWDLKKKEGRFDHELIFSVYNAYGRKNPVALHFNKIENDAGNLVVPYNYYEQPDLVPTMFYLYTIVPSLAYHFSF